MPHVDAAGEPRKTGASMLPVVLTLLVIALFIGIGFGWEIGDRIDGPTHYGRGVADALNHPERFERVQADPRWVVKGKP